MRSVYENLVCGLLLSLTFTYALVVVMPLACLMFVLTLPLTLDSEISAEYAFGDGDIFEAVNIKTYIRGFSEAKTKLFGSSQ